MLSAGTAGADAETRIKRSGGERPAERDRKGTDQAESDCEDQGYSNVAEGCNAWPCVRQPLERWSLGWRCTKCGGCY